MLSNQSRIFGVECLLSLCQGILKYLVWHIIFDFTLQDVVTSTLEALGLAYGNMLLLYCRNYTRTSRNMVKVVMMFEQLQVDAERIDMNISRTAVKASLVTDDGPRFYFSCWIYNLKLELLESFFSRGFELDVYAEFEYAMVNYYLVYLHEMQIQHYGLILSQNQKDIQLKRYTEERLESLLEIQRAVKLIAVKRELRKAVIILLSILEFKRPKPILYNPKSHYEHRFKIFYQMGSPIPKSFPEFEEEFEQLRSTKVSSVATVSDFQIHDRLVAAMKGFKAASAGLDALLAERKNSDEWVSEQILKVRHSVLTPRKKELKSIKRACIGNSVGIQALLNARLKDSSKDDSVFHDVLFRSMDFKYHPAFPVVHLAYNK